MYKHDINTKIPNILNDNPKNNVTSKKSNANHPILIDKKEKPLTLSKTFKYKKK